MLEQLGGRGDPNLPSPVSCTSAPAPFSFGLLPFTLFRLRNIKDCCVLSLYFFHFSPFQNFHFPSSPLPSPEPLPPPILPGSHTLSPLQESNAWNSLISFWSFLSPYSCDIDLGLVIDDTKGNFSLIKNFTKHLVSKFQISDNGTRVGAITFGRKANLRLRFSDLKGRENNLESVKKQIDSWHEDPPLPNVINIYFHSISAKLFVLRKICCSRMPVAWDPDK